MARTRPEPVTLAEARIRVEAAVDPLPAERVELDLARERVLAEPIRAPGDRPPFASSAMDGFAVVAGPARELTIVGEARAGHASVPAVRDGEAIRISTGAPIPAGADAVVPVERVDVADGRVRVPDTARGTNVRAAGEDVRTGDLVLDAGTRLGPFELAVLASLGHAAILCHARPRVSVIVTGDELVAPGTPAASAQIYDSNTTALTSAAERAGAHVVERRRVGDDLDGTVSAIDAALSAADVVCICGGASVGEHDHAKPENLGLDEVFRGVRLKPGKPAWFATRGPQLVFGLPGNPVSAIVTFHLFARLALRRLQGDRAADPTATARLQVPLRQSPERAQVIRCRLHAADDGWHAAPTGEQGSHILTSMLGADAFALIPAGDGTLPAGSRVDIELVC